MTFRSLNELLSANLKEADRTDYYSDVSELSDDERQKVREEEHALWVEANRDFNFQRDVANALSNIENLNALIQGVQDDGLPLPRTRFANSELGTILATPIQARLRPFEELQQRFLQIREVRGVYHSMSDECILLTVAPLWSQTQGTMQHAANIDVLMTAWSLYPLTSRLEEYKRELLQTDVPKPAPRKRVKLLEEERVWRMNYFLRVHYENIPKRNDTKDKSAYQTMYDLWTRNETPTKEQTEAIEEWKHLQERRAKDEEEYGRYKSSRARAVRGKWYVLRFNTEYGLLYNEEVDGPDHENDFARPKSTAHYYELVELMSQTSLMYPISDDALPTPVQMDEKAAETWQRKCPGWMSTWSHKLVRHERDAFIMF